LIINNLERKFRTREQAGRAGRLPFLFAELLKAGKKTGLKKQGAMVEKLTTGGR
jgi:hypothetical protein